jgi:hypothetical protein
MRISGNAKRHWRRAIPALLVAAAFTAASIAGEKRSPAAEAPVRTELAPRIDDVAEPAAQDVEGVDAKAR